MVEDKDILIKLFASCHTVRQIEGEFMGDELDLRMFLFTQFVYELPQNLETGVKLRLRKGKTILEVLHINQF